MTDLTIKNLTKEQAKYFEKHLQEEHPITKGKIEVDSDFDIPELN